MPGASPLRVVVADDEPPARKRLVRLVQARPDTELVAEATTGPEALEAIRRYRPDLALLDIQMPEMTGLDVVAALRPEEQPAVVFVTAYDEHAVRAFELHAVDYLLKPFDDDRFDQAIERARGRSHGGLAALSQRLLDLLRASDRADEPGDLDAARPARTDRLAIRTGDRIVIVRADEIDWIEGAGVYARLHTGPRSHLIRETLTNLCEMLDPERFVRIHRSTVVNRDRVRELRSYFHGEYLVLLEDGTQLKLSRTYRQNLDRIAGKLS